MTDVTAYVFAHPGHEFRLLGTITSGPSVIHILTHGSRSTSSTARINASRALATRLDASHGLVFGVASDRDFYQSILAEDVSFFDQIIENLALSFERDSVSRVVLDGWQNYNPIHDLAHLCGRLAAHRAARRSGRPLKVLDYPVVFGSLTTTPIGPAVCELRLTPADAQSKLDAIKAYPDIADDAEALIDIDPEQALTLETLHELLPLDALLPTGSPPFYELYGRMRVDDGSYSEVITWPHIQPIMQRLQDLQPTSIPVAA